MKVLIFLVITSQCVGVYINWLEDGFVQFSKDFAFMQTTLLFIAFAVSALYHSEK